MRGGRGRARGRRGAVCRQVSDRTHRGWGWGSAGVSASSLPLVRSLLLSLISFGQLPPAFGWHAAPQLFSPPATPPPPTTHSTSPPHSQGKAQAPALLGARRRGHHGSAPLFPASRPLPLPRDARGRDARGRGLGRAHGRHGGRHGAPPADVRDALRPLRTRAGHRRLEMIRYRPLRSPPLSCPLLNSSHRRSPTPPPPPAAARGETSASASRQCVRSASPSRSRLTLPSATRRRSSAHSTSSPTPSALGMRVSGGETKRLRGSGSASTFVG